MPGGYQQLIDDKSQFTKLDHLVARDVFGWRWLAFIDRPVRSHPDYPREMRVRRFFPPEHELSDRWKKWLLEEKAEPANLSEPLSYCYESTMGPHRVPPFNSDGDAMMLMEEKLYEPVEDGFIHPLWERYEKALATIVHHHYGIDPPPHPLVAYPLRCLAALVAVDSKAVEPFNEDNDETPDIPMC